MPYLVKVRGEDFNTDDLTLGEAERIEAYTGESWLFLHPLRTAKHCAAVMLVVLLRKGLSEDEALKEIRALNLNEVMDAVRPVDPDLPDTYEDGIPKAEAEPSTPGSSGAEESSAGPPTSPDASPSAT